MHPPWDALYFLELEFEFEFEFEFELSLAHPLSAQRKDTKNFVFTHSFHFNSPHVHSTYFEACNKECVYFNRVVKLIFVVHLYYRVE